MSGKGLLLITGVLSALVLFTIEWFQRVGLNFGTIFVWMCIVGVGFGALELVNKEFPGLIKL